MDTCYTCDDTATWVFNDGKLACDSCHEEHHRDVIVETENDLSWPIGPGSAIAA